jgi:hypothetical protein
MSEDWAAKDEDELVRLAGEESKRIQSGVPQPDPRAAQAQAELTRRLVVELRRTIQAINQFAADSKTSARVVKYLTVVVIVISSVTVVIAFVK